MEKRRVAGESAGDLAAFDAELAGVFEALAGAGVAADAKATEFGSMITPRSLATAAPASRPRAASA